MGASWVAAVATFGDGDRGTPGAINTPARRPGDSNGDGEFNSADIIQVLGAIKFETGDPATFQEGDWNSDGVFDTNDIILALSEGNYQSNPDPATRLLGPVDSKLADLAFNSETLPSERSPESPPWLETGAWRPSWKWSDRVSSAN